MPRRTWGWPARICTSPSIIGRRRAAAHAGVALGHAAGSSRSFDDHRTSRWCLRAEQRCRQADATGGMLWAVKFIPIGFRLGIIETASLAMVCRGRGIHEPAERGSRDSRACDEVAAGGGDLQGGDRALPAQPDAGHGALGEAGDHHRAQGRHGESRCATICSSSPTSASSWTSPRSSTRRWMPSWWPRASPSSLQRRISHKRAMKQAVLRALKAARKGCMIRCGGRLAGSEMARVETVREGQVPSPHAAGRDRLCQGARP